MDPASVIRRCGPEFGLEVRSSSIALRVFDLTFRFAALARGLGWEVGLY